MSQVCRHLHETLVTWPRFTAGFDPANIPANGLYFLFETGEKAHGVERIVRVGTHTGQDNLPKRLNEHLYTPNKDRSIFRKHIGRCLLARQGDPFLEFWEIDLTTRKNREKFEHLVDKEQLAETEEMVTAYITANFSFTVLYVQDKDSRLKAESGLLSTIAQCQESKASPEWLGNHHPNSVIRASGLWNIQGLDKEPFSIEDVEILLASQ